MTAGARVVAGGRTQVVVARAEVVLVVGVAEVTPGGTIRHEIVGGEVGQARRRGRARTAAGERDRRTGVQGTGRVVAVTLQDLVVLHPACVGGEVAAAIFGAHADEQRGFTAEAVGDVAVGQGELCRIGRGAAGDHITELDGAGAAEVVLVLIEVVLTRDLDALEVLLRDEVHDACDGIRTVDGGSATGQDFHALDELRGDLVEVGCRLTDAAVGHATTVDEHEGARGAETAEVDRRGARGAVGDRRVLRGEGLRQLVDEVLDAGDALRFDVSGGDLGDRAARLEVGLLDARTRDDDRLKCGGIGGILRVGERGDDRGRDRSEHQCTTHGECDGVGGTHEYPPKDGLPVDLITNTLHTLRHCGCNAIYCR